MLFLLSSLPPSSLPVRLPLVEGVRRTKGDGFRNFFAFLAIDCLRFECVPEQGVCVCVCALCVAKVCVQVLCALALSISISISISSSVVVVVVIIP